MSKKPLVIATNPDSGINPVTIHSISISLNEYFHEDNGRIHVDIEYIDRYVKLIRLLVESEKYQCIYIDVCREVLSRLIEHDIPVVVLAVKPDPTQYGKVKKLSIIENMYFDFMKRPMPEIPIVWYSKQFDELIKNGLRTTEEIKKNPDSAFNAWVRSSMAERTFLEYLRDVANQWFMGKSNYDTSSSRWFI